MKYSTAVVACTAILSAVTVLAAPHSERSFDDFEIEARTPERGGRPGPNPAPGPRPPVQEDPRLQFTGGRIPGERKKPVKKEETTAKTEKRSIYDLYLVARGQVLSKPVRVPTPPIKTDHDKRSVDDVYLDARGNVLSKPVKPNKRSIDDSYLDARGNVLSKPVKPNKRSVDDMYLEARGPGTPGVPKPKPKPQPIVPKPEDDPRLKFIGGKIPGERVRTRSLDNFDLESREYFENLAEMFERALEERGFNGYDDLD